jgi:hypothetical protein
VIKKVTTTSFAQDEGGIEMKAEPQANPARDKFHERIHANHMYGLWELQCVRAAADDPKAHAVVGARIPGTQY